MLILPQLAVPQAPYNPDAADFDGSTFLRRNNNIGASNSKEFTLSFWLKPDAAGGSTRQIWFIKQADTTSIMQVNLGSTGTINVSTPVCTYAVGGVTDNVWNHILISADLTTSNGSAIVVNDTVASLTIQTESNSNILFSAIGDMHLGKDTGASNDNYDGDMAEMYLITGQSLDPSVTANRRKFITSSGRPANLGDDGSNPFGVQPEIYFRGDASSFDTNLGDGGAFTTTGTLGTASTKPAL